MTISIFLNGQNCQQVIYNKEDAFEKFIVDNAETIFGANSIYVDMKHQIDNLSLGGTIPDGVLIDLSDMENPEFYLVEIELQNHDFRSHIYPQIDKFFDFFSNIRERNKLTEKIDSMFRQQDSLRNKLKNIIGEREIYKFLKDTIEDSQNILIIIDGPKSEIEDTMKGRLDTWGKWVNVQIVNHFKYDNQNIIIANPPLQNLKFGDYDSSNNIEKPDAILYTEEYHLDGCNENVKNIYNKLKQTLFKIKSSLILKPVKTYIGVSERKNIAYICFRKNKITVLVLLAQNEVNDILISRYHKVISHPSSYWHLNKPNCDIEITDTEHFDEIERLLQKVVANNEEL